MSQHALVQSIANVWPPSLWQGRRVVVAVSGGADSVAALRALVELASDKKLLRVAHYNHGWRGAESDQDAQFVERLSQALGLSVVVGQNDARDQPRSEQSARQLRYEFLQQTAEDYGADFVVTAHTGSDRVETLLHNLCRGTGLAGAAVPALHRPMNDRITLVRPLIQCSRESVLDYLQSLSQVYREDSSNQDQSYRRNFLRQTVLPLLRESYGTNVDARLLHFSELVEQTLYDLYSLASDYWQSVAQLESEWVSRVHLQPVAQAAIRFPGHHLLEYKWTVVQLALQQQWQRLHWPLQSMTRRHWRQVQDCWRATVPPSKFRPRRPKIQFQLPGPIQLSTCQGWLTLSPKSTGTRDSLVY